MAAKHCCQDLLIVRFLLCSPGICKHNNKATNPPDNMAQPNSPELAPPGWKRDPEKMASSSSPTQTPSPMQAFTHLPTFRPQANGTSLRAGLQSPQQFSRTHCMPNSPPTTSSPTAKHDALQETQPHLNFSEVSSLHMAALSHETSADNLGHQLGPVMERGAQRSSPSVPSPSQPSPAYRTVSSAPASPQLPAISNGRPQSERIGAKISTLPRCPNSIPFLGPCSVSIQLPAPGYGFADTHCPPTPAFPIATAYYTGAENSSTSYNNLCGPQQPPLPEKHHLVAARNWERSSSPGRSLGSAHHVTFAPGMPDSSTPGPGNRIDEEEGVCAACSPF